MKKKEKRFSEQSTSYTQVVTQKEKYNIHTLKQTNKAKKHDTMCPPEITNPMVMTSNENDLEELSDKEFKPIITMAILKQLKKDMNCCKKRKHKS